MNTCPSLLEITRLTFSPSEDTHVPRAGRDLIRAALEDANVPVSVKPSAVSPVLAHLPTNEFLVS